MDVLGRGLAERLGALWKVPVIVENRAGASGNIGMAAVARAEPNGYTLAITLDDRNAQGASWYEVGIEWED